MEMNKEKKTVCNGNDDSQPLANLRYNSLDSLLLGERTFPTGYWSVDRRSTYNFITSLSEETRKSYTLTDVNVKAALSPQLYWDLE